MLRNAYLKIGYQLWQKEEELRKDFNFAKFQTLPINSCTFKQFKVIQEIMLLILNCKTVYYYRKDLPSTPTTSRTRVNSIMRNGLIAGGKSLKRGRQAVFFTTVNPMDDGHGMGETPRDLTNPRIAPYKNTWKRLQDTVCWCNLKLAQEKGLQFDQTRSHAVVLHNTLLAACIEKAVCLKTQDELYQKVRLTPRVPRVELKSYSQYGQQDPQSQDARSSWEPSSDSKSYGETCNNTIDCRIPSVPLSAVEQQDTARDNKVKKLIEKFENHKYKESFLQDLSQTQKINKFSKESQDLTADLNNTEIFELCENSSKQQCLDCNGC